MCDNCRRLWNTWRIAWGHNLGSAWNSWQACKKTLPNILTSNGKIQESKIIKTNFLQVGLLNVDGYYNSLLSFIDKAVEEGFISPTAREIIVSEPTAKELVKKLEVNWRKWIVSGSLHNLKRCCCHFAGICTLPWKCCV